jgi:hypothetical protein
MTVEQIKSQIRTLDPTDRIELCRWLDHEIAAECSSSDGYSRIGSDRSLEIRRQMNETTKISGQPKSRLPGPGARAADLLQKNLSLPGNAI